jgi:hypothetical protein
MASPISGAGPLSAVGHRRQEFSLRRFTLPSGRSVVTESVQQTDRVSTLPKYFFGGSYGGQKWKHTQEQAIGWIEDGTLAYYVNKVGHEVDVILAKSQYGHKYLKTTAIGPFVFGAVNDARVLGGSRRMQETLPKIRLPNCFGQSNC